MPPIDFATVSLLLESLLFGGLALLALRRPQTRQAPGRWLAASLLLLPVWAGLLAAGRLGLLSRVQPAFLFQFPRYLLFFHGLALFCLARALLRRRLPWRWPGLALAFLAAVWVIDTTVFPLADPLWASGRLFLPRWAAALAGLFAGWALCLAGAALTGYRVLRRGEEDSDRNRAAYWLISLAPAALGGGLFFAGQTLLSGACLAFWAVAAVYVVLQARLPDLRRLVRRQVSSLAVLALTLIVYTALLIAVQMALHSLPAYNPVLAGAALALLLALLLNPLLARLQGRLRLAILGAQHEPTHVLRQYSQSITNVLDLGLLGSVAAATAAELLDIRRASLFLVDYTADNKTFRLHGVRGLGPVEPEPVELAADGPLAARLGRDRLPLGQAEIDREPAFRLLSPFESAWLAALGAEVYVPVVRKNEWIGLLAFGPKASGAAFDEADLELLCTLADQTAVALENTRLVDGLKRLNDDYRRMNAALDQANQNLERLDRTKSDFISIASHELRTPLTLVSGSCQMLLEEEDLQRNPYYSQLLNTIRSGSKRLQEIVEAMLDMARIDTRDLQLALLPVSIEGLFDALRIELRESILERKQTLQIQGLDSLPLIRGDLPSLRKVFYHLLVNAIKYTPDGGKITVRGDRVAGGGERTPRLGVEIRISDTGIGIDPRYHDLIFVKFYRAGELALHSSGKTKFKGGGPGLGLSIVRGIVEAHGGRVWVESPGFDEQAHPGSHFHVYLPLDGPAS